MDKGGLSFLIILFYLIALLVITVINGKKVKQKNAEGFFLASRGVSSILLPLTMIAAMQSTFAFLGAPGMYYKHGIGFIVLILGQSWVALMVIYFGNKIRKLSLKRGYMSVGDYFEDRFSSSYLKLLASLISIVMTLVFLSMQYVGNAKALNVVSGGVVNYQVAILISVVFSLLYVLIGGARGCVTIDAIQAVILLVGIAIAAWVAIVPAGGLHALFQNAATNNPELLSRPGPAGLYDGKNWIMQFIVLPFGIWFCPYIWSRSLMAKDEKALARSAISIPVSQVLIYGFATLFIGIAGHQLLTDVPSPDSVLPMLMINYSNWVLAAIIMAAAIAAGISTINAMLLSISQIMSQDIILHGKKGKIDDRKNIIISRVVVFVMALIGGVIAMKPPATLVSIVIGIAYTGLAQLAPAFILGLYWKNARKEGAIAGMTAGIIILFATQIFKISPLGYPGFLWAFFINIILIVIVSLALKSKDNARVEQLFFSKAN